MQNYNNPKYKSNTVFFYFASNRATGHLKGLHFIPSYFNTGMHFIMREKGEKAQEMRKRRRGGGVMLVWLEAKITDKRKTNTERW